MTPSKTVSEAARALGRSGGKSGTGKAKRRGSKKYYAELALKAAAKKRENNAQKESQRSADHSK